MNEIFNGQKYLLVNPPIQDFRLPWGQWHLPMGLLQIASFLMQNGKDVELVDALYHPDIRNIPKKKVGEIERGAYSLNLWQFGFKTFSPLKQSLRKLSNRGWIPDKILVTSLNSIWWKSIAETIDVLKDRFPNAPTILGGAYPSYEYLHASKHCNADVLFTKTLSEVSNISASVDIYEKSPRSIGIYFYSRTKGKLEPRSIDDLILEIKTKINLGVSEFIFFDELFAASDIELLKTLLSEIEKIDDKAKFIFNGNIRPEDITSDLASKMKKAKVSQIFFNSSIDFNAQNFYTNSLDEYEQAIGYLVKDGKYKARSGALAAMLPIGLPFEDLSYTAERLLRLSSIVGLVIPVPFQYVPTLHNEFSFGKNGLSNQNNSLLKFIEKINSPESLNGKLFPFAELSGYSFEEYVDVIRMSALLNSRYRSQTFDFLGSNMTSSLVRESIRSSGWDPFRS